MQILIDLDYTLLDTDKFKKEIELKINREEYSDLLYSDALSFLAYAAQYGTLVLFSEGEVDFQKEKVQKTGLEKLFGQNIKIYPSYKKGFDLPDLAKGNDLVLIDDKPKIIDQAVLLGIKAIRVRRGKYLNSETVQNPFCEVESLDEIISKDLLGSLQW